MKVHDVSQNTEAWEALRSSMPTASAASQLVTSTGKPSTSMKKYAAKLAQNKYAGKSVDAWKGNKHTERGHEIEPESISAYEFQAGIPTSVVGFCTDDHERYGASPDRFAGEDGLVEAKCLPERHLDALLYYKKHGKCPSERIPQVQFQMMVCEKEWCDVLFYHPDLPMLIIRQYPDKEFVKALKIQIAECIAERNRIFNILKDY